jgi:NIPSNAP
MIIELRQYTLRHGQRDTLIDLFEREFVEPQEAEGMRVIGTFRDLDRPDRFVWMRGFDDMASRPARLAAFYGGPVWLTHREAANATMIDSDNVLLLRGDGAMLETLPPRPGFGERRARGIVLVAINYLKSAPAQAAQVFETEVKPQLEKAGVPVLASLVTETAANNFPRLPMREGENVLVWLSRLSGVDDDARWKSAIDDTSAPLRPHLSADPEMLQLEPTSRSQLR